MKTQIFMTKIIKQTNLSQSRTILSDMNYLFIFVETFVNNFNMKKPPIHNFHIPVMGLAFTIDTPLKVAKFGINSVISIIEDELIERMREIICTKEKINYVVISNKEMDYRARRITAYLNLLNEIVEKQILQIREERFEFDRDINKYFKMLPDDNIQKQVYNSLPNCDAHEKVLLQNYLKQFIVAGSIDVNIMTKLDKTNYDLNKQELPTEYSDALAALRGFAKSNLNSAIIFSAGMNPRLFSYCENFEDFYPNIEGKLNKQIILKVSDYRSALIQGKYLAKKGLWVSEFRVESGINCGGHAFVSNGILLGPILEDFKNKREDLMNELFEDTQKALQLKNRRLFDSIPELKITAQGGLGTSQENSFLLNYYKINSTGWGSPFLLVPEATNVDVETLKKLATAKKEDYYVSHASPLGVPFNNFRKSSSEIQRKNRIVKNRPGSPCYKKFLVSNTEFTDVPICTASREYQNLKIEFLKKTISDTSILNNKISQIEEKDCLCEGLGASALIVNQAKLSHNLRAVTVCPGPNLAYFSGVFSLQQMVDHIYGRLNILNNLNRPNVFINELQLYVTYLKTDIENSIGEITSKKISQFNTFKNNLLEGIKYYENLFEKFKSNEVNFIKNSSQILQSLKESLNQTIIPSMPHTI